MAERSLHVWYRVFVILGITLETQGMYFRNGRPDVLLFPISPNHGRHVGCVCVPIVQLITSPRRQDTLPRERTYLRFRFIYWPVWFR